MTDFSEWLDLPHLSQQVYLSGLVITAVTPVLQHFTPFTNFYAHTHARTHARTHTHICVI